MAFAASVLAAPAAVAQVPAGTGHEGPSAKPAPRAATRVMDIQPRLDGVHLIDQNGRAVTLAEAIGNDGPVMVNFIFTTCTTICPVMSAGFSQLQASLGSELDHVRLVSISIDPEADTPATLRAYAKRYHAGGSWVFLTGTPEASEAAQSAFGANRGDKTNHAPTTYVRRSPDSAWEQLDGLSSGEALLAAFRGASSNHRQH
jgi:protein SCO1/2